MCEVAMLPTRMRLGAVAVGIRVSGQTFNWTVRCDGKDRNTSSFLRYSEQDSFHVQIPLFPNQESQW